MSGCGLKLPHTMLAATYLTSASLKIIVRDCVDEVKDLVESRSAELLNIAVDGESLHLLTTLRDGTPGTELSLAKQIISKMKQFSKHELCQLVSRNKSIDIEKDMDEEEEDVAIVGDITDDIEDYVEENIADVQVSENLSETLSLEDLESYFGEKNCSSDMVEQRYIHCKKMKVSSLRAASLKYLFPSMKNDWIRSVYGKDKIIIKTDNKTLIYTPSTVFEKTKSGFIQTITFDAAHILNLLRESAAKGKLAGFGLSDKSLLLLSEKPGYAYLKKILRLKKGKLEFDPMNQLSSSLCFSEKTEEGLLSIKDFAGSNCCKILRKGIFESFDTSGISSQERCLNVYNLKQFLYSHIKVHERLKRPGGQTITNELWQMINASLDSHIVTSLSLEFFHPRRKSTGSVEQFFGHLTMLCDGGMKLNCNMIGDILSRVSLTNALRMIPDSVKGFSFLAHLKTHMKSYTADKDNQESQNSRMYPKLLINLECSFVPEDSSFDRQSFKKRKTLSSNKINPNMDSIISDCSTFDGSVRKFHKKF